mgnify:CR=1 FL=1
MVGRAAFGGRAYSTLHVAYSPRGEGGVEEDGMYLYQCPCGDMFEITREELEKIALKNSAFSGMPTDGSEVCSFPNTLTVFLKKPFSDSRSTESVTQMDASSNHCIFTVWRGARRHNQP